MAVLNLIIYTLTLTFALHAPHVYKQFPCLQTIPMFTNIAMLSKADNLAAGMTFINLFQHT